MSTLKKRLSRLGYSTKNDEFLDSLGGGSCEIIATYRDQDLLRVVASGSKGYYYFSIVHPVKTRVLSLYKGPPMTEENLLKVVSSDTPKKKRHSKCCFR